MQKTTTCVDLSKHLVHNHSDMEDLIILGNANRTTARTCMNDVSSRSHAIFTISFTQVKGLIILSSIVPWGCGGKLFLLKTLCVKLIPQEL